MNIDQEWEEWLSDKTDALKATARKIRPGSKIINRFGEHVFVVSYLDDGSIGVSHIDPLVDYDRAIVNTEVICAHHVDNLIPIGRG